MKKHVIRLGLGLLLVAGLTACGAQKSAEPAPAPASSSAGSTGVNAEAIAKSSCISCHGTDLEGRGAPSLQKVGAKLTKEQIIAKIANGGGGMPSYKNKLKEEEIGALAEWLAAKK